MHLFTLFELAIIVLSPETTGQETKLQISFLRPQNIFGEMPCYYENFCSLFEKFVIRSINVYFINQYNVRRVTTTYLQIAYFPPINNATGWELSSKRTALFPKK